MTSMSLLNEGGETRRQVFANSYRDGFLSTSTLMVRKKITLSKYNYFPVIENKHSRYRDQLELKLYKISVMKCVCTIARGKT